ncbi:uncharacterized protein BXZ73DRAFT_102971 [Epithele typhae]|uniref:uncharacterized protein n=1 Tax=Epithele typhae TaxID=378194 RepID=UPI0020077B8D|nr:uncharacterized protein BXZ73DRAFT_102971 [Epithele typhae]KAH9926289.1 hypothetical protein BXZ73DRAFT_102971 [Epithele typhae]
MVRAALATTLLSASLALALGPRPGQFKNLVTFGDSYTDVDAHADGGVMWPVFAAQEGRLALYPFAKAGATCSNNITARPFPSLFESQLPAFFAARANGTLPALRADETVYTLWIGTNDVGANALLTGQHAPRASVVDVVACAVNWVRVLYGAGARNFVFQNMIPLETTPLYAPDSYTNHYWTAARNTTEWSEPEADTLTGSPPALFDAHALFTDMYAHPARFLNGTAPLNVTGAVRSCVYAPGESTGDPGVCTVASGTDADSFLWFDELHPSVQAERVVAKVMVDTIERKSEEYATWLL